MFRIYTFFVALLLLAQPGLSFAQEDTLAEEPISNGLICSQDFSLEAVTVTAATPLEQTLPGVTMGFEVQIQNQNPHPALLGRLTATVYQLEEGRSARIVDVLEVSEGVLLPEDGTKTIEHVWRVPNNAAAGSYLIEYGLAFSGKEVVVAGYSNGFTITSSNLPAQLIPDSIKINGETFRTFDETVLTDDQEVTISIDVENKTQQQKLIPLQWNQYNGSYESDENRQNTKTEILTIESGETKTVSYTVPSTNAKQMLVSIMIDDGAKSISRVQFNKATPYPVLAVSGISTFPVITGQTTNLFGCVEFSGELDLSQYSLTYDILNTDDVSIGGHSFSDLIEPLSAPVAIKESADALTIVSTLSKQGIPVSQTVTTYDCEVIDSNLCFVEESGVMNFFDMIFSSPLFWYSGIVILLLLLALVWSVHRRHHKGPDINVMNTSAPALLFALLLGGGLLFAGNTTHAIEVNMPDSEFDDFGGDGGSFPDDGTGDNSGTLPDTSGTTNTAPGTPQFVSPPTSGETGTSYSFSAQSSDIDGDTIRYEFDWDGNGVHDAVMPQTGYVNSGTTQASSWSWSSAGTYTVQVRAFDGTARSAWRSHTITIAAPSTPSGNSGTTSGGGSTTNWPIKSGPQCGTSGSDFCPEDASLQVGFSASGPTTVTAGANYTLTGGGWCNGDDSSGEIIVNGYIQNGPKIGDTGRIDCRPGVFPVPAGSVTLTAPATTGQHCVTYFVQGDKVGSPIESDYDIQQTQTAQFCTDVVAASGGSCSGTVASIEFTGEDLYPVDCQSIDQGGNVGLPACSNFDYEEGDTVTNERDIANGECIIGPVQQGGGRCSYETVTITENSGSSCGGGDTSAPTCATTGVTYTAYNSADNTQYQNACTDAGYVFESMSNQDSTSGYGGANAGECLVNYDPDTSDSLYTYRLYRAPGCSAPTPGSCTAEVVETCVEGNCSDRRTVSAGGGTGAGVTAWTNWNVTVDGNTQMFYADCSVSDAGGYSCTNNESYTLDGVNFSVNINGSDRGTMHAASSGVMGCTVPGLNPAADLRINGSDGPITIDDTGTLDLTWTATDVDSCTLYGAGLPGGAVVFDGSDSIAASTITGSETYVFTCLDADGNSYPDSVDVTVNSTNTPPNPPTIAGPRDGETSTDYTFTFTATDDDGDQVEYDVDWNNDGIADVTSMLVNSGVGVAGTQSWPTASAYTFQARARDTHGATSAWASHDIDITQSAPASASIEASINNGAWSSADVTIGAEDDVRIRWSSSNAGSCSETMGAGFGFVVSGTSGTDSTINNLPANGSPNQFAVTCGGATASINLTAERADLVAVNGSVEPDTGSFDSATGRYATGVVRVIYENDSLSAVPATTATLNYNGDTFTGSANDLAGGGGVDDVVRVTVTDIDLGTFSGDLTLNLPDTVDEKTRSNNTITVDGTVPAPNPGLYIDADRTQVRPGDTVTLTWGATDPYPGLSCTVEGPNFSTRTNVTPTTSGESAPSGMIEAKSEYTITCTHPNATDPFTASVTVESVGTLEEV